MMPQCRSRGVTLIEILIVLAVLGILATFGVSLFRDLLRDWRLKDAAHQLLEDVREVQSRAMKAGDFVNIAVGSGRQFRQQAVFLVFDVNGRSYKAWQWIDKNNNGLPEASPNDVLVELFTRSLPAGIDFSSGIASKTACSASDPINPLASHKVTFDTKSYPPCDGNRCIQFDAQGTINDKGNLYLSDNRNSWAINSLSPGFFRLCRWAGNSWD